MKKQFLLMALILAQTTILCAFNNTTRSNYLNRYSEIAVIEMQRSSIPASITLAQGILESSWGQGTLAVRSNNHFGIKCKDEWDGPTVHQEDDDYINGKLVQSCFRAYDDPLDSYRDHTDFLLNRERYASLFELHPMDYIGWAKGLKACGYATAPDYAERLIRIIEENQLYVYDVQYIKENETEVAGEITSEINSEIEQSMSSPEGVENEDEEYLDIVVPSNVNTHQREQTVYTEIYTTHQTPDLVEEVSSPMMDPVSETESEIEDIEYIETVVVARPIIYKPLGNENNHLQLSKQVFAAPTYDISRFIEEQNYDTTTTATDAYIIPDPVERERSSQIPTNPTFVPAERLMKISQQKNHTEPSKRGISLGNLRLR